MRVSIIQELWGLGAENFAARKTSHGDSAQD